MNPEAVGKLLHKELASEGKIYPDYGRYCINAVPALLADLFDGKRTTPLTKAIVPGGDDPVATVITFLIDGLGYRKATKVLRNMPTEESSILNQNIYPVTSVFPSETTAALTSLLTGVPPNRHGLPGWLLHFKKYGKTVQCPEFVSVNPRNKTINFDVDDVLLSECTPVFEKLSERGVSSYSYLRDEIATGAYSYRLYS
ncbi:hypothetical protein EXE53_30105, partial [Halorubrum sp. SD626R]|uniref:alkaline phosphatase family protein n=1 Tax=Halorubrum sp. SD626R TaxID=1419722 RepID=UPI001134226B